MRKHIFITLACICTLSFQSCYKKPEKNLPSEMEKNILGEWTINTLETKRLSLTTKNLNVGKLTITAVPNTKMLYRFVYTATTNLKIARDPIGQNYPTTCIVIPLYNETTQYIYSNRCALPYTTDVIIKSVYPGKLNIRSNGNNLNMDWTREGPDEESGSMTLTRVK